VCGWEKREERKCVSVGSSRAHDISVLRSEGWNGLQEGGGGGGLQIVGVSAGCLKQAFLLDELALLKEKW